MAISTIVEYTGTAPMIGQTQTDFDNNTSEILLYLDTFAPALNVVSAEINTAITTTNINSQSAKTSEDNSLIYKNLSLEYRNEASASAASALASKVSIDAKVIPTEATYNYAYLDSASNTRDLENFLDFKF